MARRHVAFRTRQPSRSNKQPSAKNKWRPKGSFRLLDLPPELRTEILELAVLDLPHKDILHLFMTCKRIYEEAASMFYHEVVLDTTESKGTADPFLSGPLTSVASRRYVCYLVIRFYIKDHVHLFQDPYSPALHDMVQHGRLQHLRLEIRSRFPASDFWGGSPVQEDWGVLTGKNKDKIISAPLYVTKGPFQGFLKFLKESDIPNITLFIDGEDHHPFWCPFHRKHPEGKECKGEWKGRAKLLKVKWKIAVGALMGAQVAKQAPGVS